MSEHSLLKMEDSKKPCDVSIWKYGRSENYYKNASHIGNGVV